MIDLNDVGVKYEARDSKGNFVCFHLIYYESLLEAVGIEDCGVYNFEHHQKIVMEKVKGILESPFDVTWYLETMHESDLVEAVKQAVMEGNRTIVIEYSDIL